GAGAVAARVLADEPPAARPVSSSSSADAVPFYGAHQAGITTPAQDRLHFVAFDVTTTERAELVDLLQEWTAAAARMTQGKDAGAFGAVGGPRRLRRTTPARPSACPPPVSP
ncbi:Dyp-type peroxidase domain-containing protein, partial [Planomonospora algeriensis]